MESSRPHRDRAVLSRDLVRDDDPDRRSRRQELLGGVQRGMRNVPEATERLGLSAPYAPLFGDSGLLRGSTVLITGAHGRGTTSLALGLCVDPTRAALWVGMLNASRVSPLSAFELGVALDHLVFIARPVERVAAVASALMEACSLVVLGNDRPVTRRDAERLQRRAREHRCVLVVLAPSTQASAHSPVAYPRQSLWPDVPDVRIEIIESTCVGIGHGAGHLLQRRIRAEISHRRGREPHRSHELVLPGDTAVWRASEEPSMHTRATVHRVG